MVAGLELIFLFLLVLLVILSDVVMGSCDVFMLVG
jgi:hypothetical protein